MAMISDIVAPSNEYMYASGANELTVVEGCVIAVGGAGIFKTGNTVLTAANLDVGSAFAVGSDYYVSTINLLILFQYSFQCCNVVSCHACHGFWT